MANLTIDVDWQIDTKGVSVIGNDQGRFDVWRQTTTLGPEPDSMPDGPPETNGAPPSSQSTT